MSIELDDDDDDDDLLPLLPLLLGLIRYDYSLGDGQSRWRMIS